MERRQKFCHKSRHHDLLISLKADNDNRLDNYYPIKTTTMLKNYILIAWRNLTKQKGTTFISVFGLGCAVGCCLVAYLFIEQVWFKGMLQPNKNEIFQLTYTAEKEEGKVSYGTVADPIAEFLPEALPHIKAQTRIKTGFPILIHNLESFNQRALYVDRGFMEMFSYKMAYGHPYALAKANEVILTQDLSEKLFGDANPIGEDITLILNGQETLYKVGGVLNQLNDMELFNFDLLVNLETVKPANPALSLKESWESESWTFVHLEEGDHQGQLQSGLNEIKRRQNEINPESPYLSLDLVAFTDLVKQS